MRLKKAFRLTCSTYSALIQTVIIQILVIALIAGVFSLIVFPTVNTVVSLLQQLNLYQEFSTIFADIASGQFSPQGVGNTVARLLNYIKDAFSQTQHLFNSVVWTYVGFIFVFFLMRFCLSFTDVASGCYIGDFMNSSGNYPLLWYLFKRIGAALKYSAFQILSTIWLDIFVLYGTIGIYITLLSSFGAVGIIIAILLFLCVYTCRQVLYAFWLPEYINNGFCVREALRNGMKKVLDCFWKLFACICLILTANFVLIIVLNIIFSGTALSYLAVVISLMINFFSFYLIRCINFTSYYVLQNKPFFTKRIIATVNTDVSTIVVE